MNWWEEFPDQYKWEVDGLNELGLVQNETKSEGFLVIDFILKKDNGKINIEQDLNLQIRYPANYPFFRPQVLTRDLNLPRHQNPVDGNLCLLARPTDNWDVGSTAASLLLEKLSLVIERGKVTDPKKLAGYADEQAEPISEYYAQTLNLQLLTDVSFIDTPLADATNTIEELGQIFLSLKKKNTDFQFGPPNDLNNFLRFEITDYVSNELAGGSVSSKIFSRQAFRYKIPWYKLREFPRLALDRIDRSKQENFIFSWMKLAIEDAKLKRLSGQGIEIHRGNIDHIIGLTYPEEIAKDKVGWQTCFLVVLTVRGSKPKKINGAQKSFLIKPTVVGPDTYSIRIPYFKELQQKKVMVVGLGTLGAPIAIDLARNGVGKLILIDCDISESGPSARWPLGQEYFGVLKPYAVADYIKKNYPLSKTQPIVHRIGQHLKLNLTTDSEIKEIIDSCDLVIDATTEEGVNHFLSFYTRKSNVPYICLEARAGVWGGLVYADKLGDNACWMCFRHYLGNEVEPPPQDPAGNIQAVGCGDLTFRGSSFDLNKISSEGVRMAISILSQSADANSYSDLHWNISVLSLYDQKSNKAIAPSWKTYQMGTHPNCPYCN